MDFKSNYNQNNFISFLRNFLPDDLEIKIEDLNKETSFKFIGGITKLGRCSSLDLNVYEIDHNSENDPRVSLSKEAFRLMKNYVSNRSLVIFKNSKTSNYRLSLITFSSSWDSGKKIKTEFSNPRRYSFYLGPDAKTKTPENFLIKKGVVKDFEDLLSRFSVEVVNKEFYREIARFFNRLVGGDVKLGSKKEHFEPEIALPSVDKNDKKTYQEFSVRLIGRIIFCWFLKQKKSNKDISLLPDKFLSVSAIDPSSDYYHGILEKIFFEVLNKPLDRRGQEVRDDFDKIPYLNGGLFDPHDDDYYENQSNYGLKIPNKWFLDLFGVLETYNFTIDENTTNDVDLSIDPEMLGRIFENLLAEINPETGESARKSTGSFYTPRPIVDYMVDQSLMQYLLIKTGIEEEKIKALISVDASDDIAYPLIQEEKNKVVNALNEVKIIDPACGSGAFPIGILQKIVFILSRVDQDGQLWFGKKTENLDPLLKEDFQKKFSNENFDYIRKTGIIRDSIYGVDIQPIAVEVSKLRCFLTLIVDEDIDENAENRGIKPLPNLEFKFVAANTLIVLPGSSLNDQIGMFEENNEIAKLKKVIDKYFVSNGHEQELIKMEFYRVQKMMFDQQIQHARNGIGKQTMALARWDPFQHETSDWFDPEWMFGIKKFDIVIGNPPYGATMSDEEKKYYKTAYECAKTISGVQKGSIDTYALFIDAGLFHLIGQDGTLCYIVPLAFTSSESMSALHKMLFKNCCEIQVSTYSNRPKKIFDNADQRVSIVLAKKNNTPTEKLLTTGVVKRYSSTSVKEIIDNLSFVNSLDFVRPGRIPKIGTEIELNILKKIFQNKKVIGNFVTKESDNMVFYRTAGGRYYHIITNYSTGSTQEKPLYLNQNINSSVAGALLSSNLYFWLSQAYSDNLHLKEFEITMCPVPEISQEIANKLIQAYQKYVTDLEKNAVVKQGDYNTISEFKEYRARLSKNIIDEFDKILQIPFGLTDEEVNFIIHFEEQFRSNRE